jgi:hypothetical protein
MLKPPYGPKVAGRMAFFFGPIAGALVTVVNLRRTGHPVKAKRIFLWTLLATAVLGAILILLPDLLGRLAGLAAEIAFYCVYPPLQENEFNEWQAEHPEVPPSNGWKALGWGLLGIVLFLLVCFLVSLPIALIFPNAV